MNIMDPQQPPEWIGLVYSIFGFRLWNRDEDYADVGAIKYAREDIHKTVKDERDELIVFKRTVSDYVRDLIPDGQSKDQADSALGVIGCISLFKKRAEAAEADRDELVKFSNSLKLAVDFMDRVRSASQDEKIAIGTDELKWLETAARSLVSALNRLSSKEKADG